MPAAALPLATATAMPGFAHPHPHPHPDPDADPYATLRSSRLASARPKHRWSTWTADSTLLCVADDDDDAAADADARGCHKAAGKEPQLAQLWHSEAAPTQPLASSLHRHPSVLPRHASAGETETEVDGPFDSESSTSASRSSAGLSDTEGSSAAPLASHRAVSIGAVGVSPPASPRGGSPSHDGAFPEHLLDAALESTSVALEQASALLQSTISARAGFARMRAAEAALEASLDTREVRLRQQIIAADEARGWVARACADLAALGVEPPSSRRAVAPRASSWRMPSTASAVAPVASTGQSAGAGWLDHKDDDATLGKSAAKRLERVLSSATAPSTHAAETGPADGTAALAAPSHARQASGARDALALLVGAPTAARTAGGAPMERSSSAASSCASASASASPAASAASSPARGANATTTTRKARSSLRLPMAGLGIGASVSGPTVQTSDGYSSAAAVDVGPLSAASTSSEMSFASAHSHAGLAPQDRMGFPFTSRDASTAHSASENEAGPSSSSAAAASRPRPSSRASIASLQSLASIDEAHAGAGYFAAAALSRACSDATGGSSGSRHAGGSSSSTRLAGERGGYRSVSASSSTTLYAPPVHSLSALHDRAAGLPSREHASQSTASLLLTPPSQSLDAFASPTPSLDGSHSGGGGGGGSGGGNRAQLSCVRSPSLARPRRPGHSASSSFSDAHGSGRFRSSSSADDDGTSSSEEEGAAAGRRRRKRESSQRDRGALAALRRLNSTGAPGEEADTSSSTASAAAAAAQAPVPAAAAGNGWGGTLASWLGASSRAAAGVGDEDVV